MLHHLDCFSHTYSVLKAKNTRSLHNPLFTAQKCYNIEQRITRPNAYISCSIISVEICHTLRTLESLLLSKTAKLRLISGASSPFHQRHILILVLPRPQNVTTPKGYDMKRRNSQPKNDYQNRQSTSHTGNNWAL
jgi:hypothetical protein